MTQHRVLIADDDHKLLKAMRARLEAAGFEVVETQDSYQAVEQARRWIPDVLILDINMPAGGGFSVHDRITKIPELNNTRVIYITGEDPARVDELVCKSGAFAVIHKPFEASAIVNAVWEALLVEH